MRRSIRRIATGAGVLGALMALPIGALVAAPAAFAAGACPNAEYRTGPSLNLPDCRAYEMVTPPDKFNQIAGWTLNTEGVVPAPTNYVAPDGETIAFGVTTGSVDDDPANGALSNWERGYRTPTGWRIERMIAPAVNAAYTDAGIIGNWALFSEDASKMAFSGSAPFTALQEPFGQQPGAYGGAFLSDGTTNTWLSQPTSPTAAPAQGNVDTRVTRWRVAGGSKSLNTVYFSSVGTHTALDDASGRPPRTSWALYRWQNGNLSNAAVLPDGTVSPGGSILADMGMPGDTATGGGAPNAPDAFSAETRALSNAVGDDGRSILFVSPDPRRNASAPPAPQPQLYLAREGQPTLLLSQPFDEDGPIGSDPVSGTGGVPAAGTLANGTVGIDVYALATADHSVIFFQTVDALTDTAPIDQPTLIKTYRYDAEGGTLTYIPEADRSLPATLRGNLLALAPNGDSLAYLAPNGDLKLWRRGASTRLLATGFSNNGSNPALSTVQAIRFSADGTKFLIQTNAPMRGEPLHANPTSSFNQSHIYRYTPANDALSCLTCKAGFPTARGASLTYGIRGAFGGGSSNFAAQKPRRAVSADADMFVFVSDLPLTDDDHNDKQDVYRWQNGEIALISSGATGAFHQTLYDMSEDGKTILILSREQLVPWDHDNHFDIYAARVNGGFDPPETADPAPCTGDGCQGQASQPLTPPTIGSASFVGDGNAPSAPGQQPAPIRVKRLKASRGSVASLRVRVPGAGRIKVSGPRVRRTGKSASKAGTYAVRIALNAKAMKALKKRKTLKAGVRIAYRASDGQTVVKTVSVTFKRPKAKRSTVNRGGEAR